MQPFNFTESSSLIVLLFIFGAAICATVWFFVRPARSSDGFLVAERQVSLFRSAISIAITWVWAPAIFISSMQAFQLGLPGIFWFTAPNVVCFFLYAPLAIRVRRLMPEGYTLPDFIAERFPDSRLPHIAFLLVFLGYQIGAILINSLAGGALLHSVSGIDQSLAIVSIACIALAYTLVSGLKASILTDVIQMFTVLSLCFVLVPFCVWHAGGLETVKDGLGGVTGEHGSLFDPWIAFSMGIPMTLSLFAGPINDQVFWQRAMSVRQNHVVKTFVYGGLLFGLVPVSLSIFGFLGAGLVRHGALVVADPQLVGPTVIASVLPKAALYAFCLMAFAALCSTMDSACCAMSSLGAVDIYRRYITPDATDRQMLFASRLSMVLLTVIGTSLALLSPKLLWCFMIFGTLASAGMFPAVFSILTRRVSARAVSLSVFAGFFLGLPYSIYANIHEAPVHIVLSAILSVAIGLCICTVSVLKNKPEYKQRAVSRPLSIAASSTVQTSSPKTYSSRS